MFGTFYYIRQMLTCLGIPHKLASFLSQMRSSFGLFHVFTNPGSYLSFSLIRMFFALDLG